MKDTLKVERMSCQHCVNAVTKTVSGIDGVQSVTVDLSAKTVTVEHDNADLEKIKAEIEEQGYEVI